MSKAKVYVVWVGRKPGIYATWPECEKQVLHFVGARYKGFTSITEAQRAYQTGVGPEPGKVKAEVSKPRRVLKKAGLAVDAACSGVPGPVEWRGVSLEDGSEVFKSQVYADGTNNIGEFLAIVEGMRWLIRKKKDWPIYSDSKNALLWVKKKKCNTNLIRTSKNKALFDLIEEAEEFLAQNEQLFPLCKWLTETWGENPADFGRK